MEVWPTNSQKYPWLTCWNLNYLSKYNSNWIGLEHLIIKGNPTHKALNIWANHWYAFVFCFFKRMANFITLTIQVLCILTCQQVLCTLFTTLNKLFHNKRKTQKRKNAKKVQNNLKILNCLVPSLGRITWPWHAQLEKKEPSVEGGSWQRAIKFTTKNQPLLNYL